MLFILKCVSRPDISPASLLIAYFFQTSLHSALVLDNEEDIKDDSEDNITAKVDVKEELLHCV